MIEKIKGGFRKYEEVISYLFFGVCTTLVNLVVYWVAVNVFHIHYLVATAIAWAFAVAFAYVTNRIFVFKSKARGAWEILREIVSFVSCRVFSGVCEIVIMFMGVDLLGINDNVVKIICQVLVVVINYVLSKLIIFKKK